MYPSANACACPGRKYIPKILVEKGSDSFVDNLSLS